MNRVIAVLVIVLANLVFCSCSFAGTNELAKLVESKEFWTSYNWGNFEDSDLYKSTFWKQNGGSLSGDKRITDDYETLLLLDNLNIANTIMSVRYPEKTARSLSIYSSLSPNNDYYIKLVNWCDEKFGNNHIERNYHTGVGEYRHEVVRSIWNIENTRAEVTFEKNYSSGLNSVGYSTTLSFYPSMKTI